MNIQRNYTKFDARYNPPKVGQVRELSKFGSQQVDAVGEVVKVDKKKRTFLMRILAKGE